MSISQKEKIRLLWLKLNYAMKLVSAIIQPFKKNFTVRQINIIHDNSEACIISSKKNKKKRLVIHKKKMFAIEHRLAILKIKKDNKVNF